MITQVKLYRTLYKITLFLLLGYTANATAELTVIADLGGQSAQEFYKAINSDDNEGTVASLPEIPHSVTFTDMLPVVTPEMSPGQVTDRPLNLPGAGKLFLAGDDDISRAWLKRNASFLIQAGAAGLIVNIADIESLQQLQQLVPGVPLAPASGSELARRLQLKHYPVLITDSGLFSLSYSSEREK